MKNARATRRRFALATAVATLLLLSAVALAQPDGADTIQEGTIAGGGYQLTRITLSRGDTMSGGGYQLLSLVEATASGDGCCCTYLPCIVRNR